MRAADLAYHQLERMPSDLSSTLGSRTQRDHRIPGVGRRSNTPSVALLFLAAGLLSVAVGGVALLAVRLGATGELSGDVVSLVGRMALVVGVALALVGLGPVVFGPVREGRDAAAAGFGTHRVMLATTAFALLLAALVGGLLPLVVHALAGQRGLRTLPGFLAGTVAVDLALYGVVYFRFLRPGVVSMDDFGFGRNRAAARFGGRVWLAHLATGLGGGMLILLLSAISAGLLLRFFGVAQTQRLDFLWIRELPANQFALVWIAGVVLAPLVEEIFFRGLVFRAYLERHGRLVAYAVSSVLFALPHMNLQAFFPLVVLGWTLAWLYRRTDSLTPVWVAHAFNNGVGFLLLRYLPLPALGGG